MVFDEAEAGSEALNFGEEKWKHSRRQLGPSATNSDHHGLRTQDAAETQFGVLIAYPIFATFIFPRIRHAFNIDTNR